MPVDPQGAPARTAMLEYFAELDARFPEGFDAGDTLDADADSFREPNGRFVVAMSGEAIAGCGGLQLLEPTVAEIKRMWVSPQHRGQGLGGRLLAHLEARARALGADRVRLDTNSVLTEAINMYTSRGYVDIDAYNDNPFAKRWFEKSLPTDSPGEAPDGETL